MAISPEKSVWKGKFKPPKPSAKDTKLKAKRKIKGKKGERKGGDKKPKSSKKGRNKTPKKKSELQTASGDALEDDALVAAPQPAAAVPKGPPSAAALEKVARLKSKKSQLSSSEFEAAKSLAATIATRTPEEQAQWMWTSYQRHTAHTLSGLERPERGLVAENFAALPRQGLEDGLKSLEADWHEELCSTSGRAAGEISALFISSAAMGAIALIKECSDLNRRCKIAKLFAKHFKVSEQVELLKKEKACIGAGTPNRLMKLLDENALKLNRLKYVVVDVSLDMKKRTLLDQPDVCKDWWELWEKYLKAAIVPADGGSGGAKIVLYGGNGQEG